MSNFEVPPPRPPLTKEERVARDEQRRQDAAEAMADHEAAEQRKLANLERLRAERLAREKSEKN